MRNSSSINSLLSDLDDVYCYICNLRYYEADSITLECDHIIHTQCLRDYIILCHEKNAAYDCPQCHKILSRFENIDINLFRSDIKNDLNPSQNSNNMIFAKNIIINNSNEPNFFANICRCNMVNVIASIFIIISIVVLIVLILLK